MEFWMRVEVFCRSVCRCHVKQRKRMERFCLGVIVTDCQVMLCDSSKGAEEKLRVHR